MLHLKNIILLEKEFIDCLVELEKEFTIEIYKDAYVLDRDLKKDQQKRTSSLLIASTDQTIRFGKEYGVATMAYANPEFPNQTYSGVEMVVEGFEEVDADFLEKVYQRWHDLPWCILETERCMVRELTLEDLDGLFELYADKGMDQYTEPLFPYEDEREYQSAYINNMYRYYGYGMWLVFLKETGELIGRAGLEHREIQGQVELELGYLIGRRYQRKGYAAEVCKAIIDYAKYNTSFEQINCVVEEGNENSIHLAKKLGFEKRESYDVDGKIMHRFVRELS